MCIPTQEHTKCHSLTDFPGKLQLREQNKNQTKYAFNLFRISTRSEKRVYFVGKNK